MGDRDDSSKSANEFLASGSSDGISSVLWPAAISGDVFRADEFGSYEPADRVVERSTLEHEDFVLVAIAQQALHLVRMHWRFAQEREYRYFPNSEVCLHIVQMNYIV